jgi:hypothetical protein
VGTADQVHVVFLQEARDNVRTECETDTSVVFAPASDVLVRIGPQEIAEKTAVRDLSSQYTWAIEGLQDTHIRRSHDPPDLLHGVEVRAETAVHGENLLIDNGSDGQAVEAVGECLPQLDIVSSLALIVETVDTVDRGALVVTTENEEVLRVLDLVCEEQADGL